ELTLLAGQEGAGRKIESPRIQKPGLALAGYVESINPNRVQILGNTELTYLMRLNKKELRNAIRRFFNLRLSAVIVTNGQELANEVVEEAEAAQTALFVSGLPTSSCIARVQNFLEETLQVATSVHGVLVDVLGVGVL